MAKILIVGRKSHHPMRPSMRQTEWCAHDDSLHKKVPSVCTISPAHKIFLLKFKRSLWKAIKLLIRVEIRTNSNKSGWWRRNIQAVCDLMRELCTISPLRQSIQLPPKTLRDRYLFLQMVHIKERFQGLAWYVTSTDTSGFFFYTSVNVNSKDYR